MHSCTRICATLGCNFHGPMRKRRGVVSAGRAHNYIVSAKQVRAVRVFVFMSDVCRCCDWSLHMTVADCISALPSTLSALHTQPSSTSLLLHVRI